jgi:tape measure domain-containing protein
MAMSGKGQEHLDGIITAVGQAWTKQKLQGEEAMQLLERGVPVWDLLSTAMGKTVPELQELATKGKLGRKEIQLLINAMGKRAVGASAKMAKSLDGVTSALSDMWTEFKSRIADSGFYRSVKDQLERTLAVVKQWASDGTMDRAAGVIGGAFTRAANAVGSAIDRIVTHTGFLNKNWDKARPYIIAITAALAGLLAAWAPITAVVLAAAFAIDEFLTYLEDGDSVIGAFIDWIKNIASAFTENPAEAGAAWARLLIEGIKNAFSGLGAILNSVFGDSSGQVNWGAIGTNIATGIFNGIRNLLSMVIGFWSEVANSLLSVNWAGVGAQAMNLLWEGMKGVVESIKAWFMSAFSGMTVPGPTISAPTVTAPRQGAPSPGGPAGTPDTNSFVPPETLKKRTDNLKGNLDRMNIGSSQVGGTRQVVYNVNAPITQHVAQATDAPGAAAKATQGAIKQAVRTQPSRLQAGAILA